MESKMSRWVLVSMIMASAASAETGRVVTPSDVDCGCDESLNRFGISYRAGFNISAKFKNLGGFNSLNNPGPATGGAAERFYDDGYNRVDGSGNAGNLTTFWGYENASQYNPADGGSITMNSTSASGQATSKNQEDDPQHGAEITFNRQLGRLGEAKWGVEAAVNFTDITIRDNATLFGDAVRTSDTFPLNGVVPPTPPYHATFDQQSGPVLGSVPFRTVTRIPNGAVIAGNRNFDAELYGMRLGPYLEIPLSQKVSLSFSGGLSLIWIHSDFAYEETVTLAGGVPRSGSGRGSNQDLLPGGYLGGNLLFWLNDTVNLSAGAQYQAAGTYSHKENGKKAQLDLGQSVFLTAGLGFSF